MPVEPILTAEAAETALAEINPPLGHGEARVEANRCLFCFDAPCIQACPTGIDVPGFIRKITTGNTAGAARTILSANVLGASCSRVCPTQVLCEGACVLDDRGERPIAIGRLQGYATDHGGPTARREIARSVPARGNGRSVAVLGAGPAGLACAAELARLGYAVTVFEKRPLAGGLNTHGVARYKLKPQAGLEEVDFIRSLGVDIRCGTEVGKDIAADRLRRDFDAVFIALGLGACAPLRIPGAGLPGVREALDFIEAIHTQPLQTVPVGRRVVVIGGGNTAIDAANQALLLGAERATLVYRRGEADLPAYPFEADHAKGLGARFLFNTVPVEILAGADGRVSGVRLAQARPGADGRPEPVPGTDFSEPCDQVLLAVGQEKQAALLRTLFPGIELDPRGVIVRDPLTGATHLPRLFAGGDCANGGREVVNAVGEGRKAAHGLHAALGGGPVPLPAQPSRLGAPGGASGSGLLAPIRAHELEAACAAARGARTDPAPV